MQSTDPPGADRSRGVLEGFAGYRIMQRRIAEAAQRGILLPFFQPRDGVSGGTISWNGRELINYSGYNYLGLSGHPEVSRAAKDAIDRYGTSASASRIVSGEIALHGELERRLASFLGTEDCMVFVSGYLTNLSVIGHLFSRPDIVVHDEMAHNSIITGCKLSGARVLGFKDDDWAALDAALTPLRKAARRGLLVTEGIYSMDGDILDAANAVAAKRRHDLMLMVDEAHSFGILGRTGRGICEHFGLAPGSIDIMMGTLSKTLASCGGYIAGDGSLVGYLRHSAPGFLFSVGLSPPDTAAALAALDILVREPERPQRLRDTARCFRQIAREYGLTVGGAEESPVVPLVVGDSERCVPSFAAPSRARHQRAADHLSRGRGRRGAVALLHHHQPRRGPFPGDPAAGRGGARAHRRRAGAEPGNRMMQPGHAVISGGSSGIGLALARKLAAAGWDLTILARDEARLEAARAELTVACRGARQRIETRAADVADAAAVERIVAAAVVALGPPALVIASAGIVIPGTFDALPDDAFRRTMEVNYFGTLNLVRAALPSMRGAGRGRIVMIASGAALLGFYGYTAYAPSKFAVRGLGEALRSELAPDGIGVSVAFPPDTDTPMLREEVRTRPAITSRLASSARLLTADAVAAAILRGVRRGRFTIAPGWEMTAIARLHSLGGPLLHRWWFDPLIASSRRRP